MLKRRSCFRTTRKLPVKRKISQLGSKPLSMRWRASSLKRRLSRVNQSKKIGCTTWNICLLMEVTRLPKSIFKKILTCATTSLLLACTHRSRISSCPFDQSSLRKTNSRRSSLSLEIVKMSLKGTSSSSFSTRSGSTRTSTGS